MMDKLMVSMFLLQHMVTGKVRGHREAGQGTLEYVAALALALIVILALVTGFTDFGTALKNKLATIATQLGGV